MVSKYVYTYDQVKSLLQSEFGKSLTEDQFNFIRKVNEDISLTDRYWVALDILLNWDLELICRING